MFHTDLQVAVKGIKESVAQGKTLLYWFYCRSLLIYLCILIESWEPKVKFPPSLKPPLANLAILAIKLDEYDEDFFRHANVIPLQ